MRVLIQRVSEASVTVDGQVCGEIGRGILLLLGVARGDSEPQADKMLHRVLSYRMFPDDEGRMNRSLRDIGGGLLVVSQFTLAAETDKGLRPSFSSATDPGQAKALYEHFVTQARLEHPVVQTGIFAADMKVRLLNDGPVTFLLET